MKLFVTKRSHIKLGLVPFCETARRKWPHVNGSQCYGDMINKESDHTGISIVGV